MFGIEVFDESGDVTFSAGRFYMLIDSEVTFSAESLTNNWVTAQSRRRKVVRLPTSLHGKDIFAHFSCLANTGSVVNISTTSITVDLPYEMRYGGVFWTLPCILLLGYFG